MNSNLWRLYYLTIFFHAAIFLGTAQHETRFIYNGFHGAKLHIDGGTSVHESGLLQLTNFTNEQMGHAFYRVPVNFNASESGKVRDNSFSTTYVCAMTPQLASLSGHGIAFVISPSIDLSNALAGEYLGLLNVSSNGLSSNHIFAVELDTVQSPVFDDIDSNHVGIDVNSLKSISAASAAYYDEKQGKNLTLHLISGKPIQVWIDYDDINMIINVTIAPMRYPKPILPLLSAHLNLSTILLDSMYIGFSSSTGAASNEQYILGWSFSQDGSGQNLDFSKLPSLPKLYQPKTKMNHTLIIMLIIILIMGMVIVGAAWVIRRKKFEELKEDWEQEYVLQRFSYKDLYRATKGFKDTELLGSGGFGKVYKGVICSNNTQIAVKKISHNSSQGIREFVAEISSMRRLRHRNLVQLLGYCRRKGELLLVYDYMPNGSLDKFLFTNELPGLCWYQRFKIIRGVASALLYLHEEWEQVVLHRDVKASNVLIDAQMNARLGDFGLARLYDHGSNPRTTKVVGTVGYIAPELTKTGKATTSTDVFSFGTFMLEVACGRRPIGLHSIDEDDLVDWVLACWKRGELLETSDPRLEGNHNIKEMELVLSLGLLCSCPRPESRPSMRQVVQILDGDMLLPEIPVEKEHVHLVATDIEASRRDAYEEYFFSADSILVTGR